MAEHVREAVDVVRVVTPLVRGVAQDFHGDQVVELRVQLAEQEVEGKEEDKEGQVEVEEREGTQRGALMDDYGDGCENDSDLEP